MLTDYDEDVLGLAALGAAENGVAPKIATARLDWSTGGAAAATLSGGPFDLVLAADVLSTPATLPNLG